MRGGTWRVATLSRVLMLSMMILLGTMLKDHVPSKSTDALDCTNESNKTGWIRNSLDALDSWDTEHYLHISMCGYTHEQNHAFFPLLPMTLRLATRWTPGFVLEKLGTRDTTELWGVFLNNLAFVASAILFHRIGKEIIGDKEIVELSTMLYCFNPASVFYSVVYTESLYALFFYGGLYAMHVSKSWWKTGIPFFACASTRSNGMLCFGFYCFAFLTEDLPSLPRRCRRIVNAMARTLLGMVICLAPYVTFQAYGYQQFCLQGEYSPSWCHKRIPQLYGHVQEVYWENGLFSYWQLKQIPNFLLAAPILSFSFYVSKDCIIRSWWQFLSLVAFGFGGTPPTKTWPRGGIYGRSYFCLVIHLAFMSIFAFLFMNVQVSTRFLSASPPLYWYAAGLCRRSKAWRMIIWGYLCTYIVLGCLLFPNWYPWT